MHAFSLLLLLTPFVLVEGSNITFGRGSTGGRCCDGGTPDPSSTCKNRGLNSYGCTDVSSSDKAGDTFLTSPEGGCDPKEIKNWPTGREVISFIPGSVVMHQNPETFDLEIGFIGCAK
ncbi:hypothetical protein PpBr36_05050 [Pyricularia pennisetigena]|uniref:hypothetical protein n=1 Tax=Pyricularia pennisetigena TaxID=1578925 RepID=UPI001153DE67|nr:hypothetical protein PpBr36_05050 [Pyricularia pennisetigena]TLS27004.1 hypothetical protein PpBr36_05050 [Pyricularia pennisetigena]